MKYYIYACEQMYGGLHGMNYSGVIEADSEKEAEEYGCDMAWELLDSYGELSDIYYGDESEIEEDEVSQYLEVIVAKVRDDLSSKFSVEELDKISYNEGRKVFIKNWCEV